jgi:hypothetical protein
LQKGNKMAQLIAAFNAKDFNPEQGTGSLPIGKHPVVITDSEVKATEKNDGGYLELHLKIIDGPQTGATGAYRLNLYNKSEKAVEIAHRQMSALCHVIGVYNVQDTQAMHNLPFVIEVAFQKGHAPGDPDSKGYTEVKKVFDINGNEPGKAGAGQQQAQPAQSFAQQQPAQQQQQPAQGFQQQQPQGGGFQQQQQAPAQGAAWGNSGQPAQQQQQAPAQQQGGAPAGGWQQQQGGAPAGGQPAWGHK